MLTRLNLNNGLVNQSVHTLLGAGSLFTTGKVFYVNSVIGSDGNSGLDPAKPLATISKAQTKARANKGDIVIIMPKHAETFTAVLTLSKAGVRYIGIGTGADKPTITVNAAVDGLSLTGASISIANIHFAAPATDNATAMINVAAANCSIINVSGIGSTTSKNFVDCITIASGADDLTIDGLEIFNTVVAVNSFISIEAAVARLRIFNTFCFGDVVAGGLIDAAAATQIHLYNLRIAVVGTTKPAATLDSNPTGMAEYCFFSGTDTTLANNGALGNAMRLNQVFLLEETDNSKQGVQIPAVDVD